MRGMSLATRYQAQLPVHVAGDYAAEREPGTVLEDFEEGAELGEKWNFGVIVLTVEEMDWLELRREGHRRAGFRWVDEGMGDELVAAIDWITRSFRVTTRLPL